MKATLGMNYRVLGANLERLSNRLYELRQQTATGKRMNRPSDDPAAIRPVLDYRVRIQATERYLDHISMSGGDLEVLDSRLEQAENILVTARETGIAAMNETTNEEDRQTYADRLEQLFEEILQAGNTQVGGKYIFSGYREDVRPFSENPAYDPSLYDPSDASTWAVHYDGDEHAKSVEIAPGEHVQTALPGNELFLGDAENNGEVDGSGTDLFSVLKNFEHAVRQNDTAAMNTWFEKLEQGADQVRRLRGRMGNNAWRIERAARQLEDASIEFEKILSGYEDADVLEVFSQLVQQETAFEAALNVTSRISKLSILDFM